VRQRVWQAYPNNRLDGVGAYLRIVDPRATRILVGEHVPTVGIYDVLLEITNGDGVAQVIITAQDIAVQDHRGLNGGHILNALQASAGRQYRDNPTSYARDLAAPPRTEGSNDPEQIADIVISEGGTAAPNVTTMFRTDGLRLSLRHGYRRVGTQLWQARREVLGGTLVIYPDLGAAMQGDAAAYNALDDEVSVGRVTLARALGTVRGYFIRKLDVAPFSAPEPRTYTYNPDARSRQPPEEIWIDEQSPMMWGGDWSR
jgi:hypothetical protein